MKNKLIMYLEDDNIHCFVFTGCDSRGHCIFILHIAPPLIHSLNPFVLANKVNQRNNKDNDCQDNRDRARISKLVTLKCFLIQIEYNRSRAVSDTAVSVRSHNLYLYEYLETADQSGH